MITDLFPFRDSVCLLSGQTGNPGIPITTE
jgi:hypothetical protein